MVLVGPTYSQYLVIDSFSMVDNNISIQDTLLSSYGEYGCTDINYKIDLDQDSVPDINFYLECYMGGRGGYEKIFVTSYNNFYIHADTSYIEHFQFIDTVGQVQNTSRITTVVRKYNFGDTIFNNQSVLSNDVKLLYRSTGTDPSCTYRNINLFLKDTSYIAFEKSNGDLYFLKIGVPNGCKLELISLKSNAYINRIDDKKISGNDIFPNPATDIINFKEGSFNSIQIYTMQGILLVEKDIKWSQKSLDISNFKSGLYTVILKAEKNRYITKLLKL